MTISKSEARKLTINVTELGAQVLRGVLTIEAEKASINNRVVAELDRIQG